MEALRRAGRAARAAGATAAAEPLVLRALAVAPTDLAGAVRLELLELLAVAGRIDDLSVVGAQALDDLAHDRDLTAAVHLLLARAAVGAGAPGDAERHLDAVGGLGVLSPRRTAQLCIVRAAAVIGGGSAERLALSGRLAGRAVAAAGEAGDPELSCEAVGLLAMSVRPRDLTAAVGVLRQELAVAERAGLVLWRLRALNELGTVEMMRDARGDRLCRAHELAVRVGALDTAVSILINLAGLHVMTDVIPETLAAAEQARQLAAPLGATQAVAAATAVEAVAHGLAGRRTEMEQRLRRAVELAPDDADIAAYATGGARGVVALLFEERAEALAAFARARELGTPIRAADPGIRAARPGRRGRCGRTRGEVELARATVGARFPATWLGYAHDRRPRMGPFVLGGAAAALPRCRQLRQRDDRVRGRSCARRLRPRQVRTAGQDQGEVRPNVRELRCVQRRLSPAEVEGLLADYEAGGWVGELPRTYGIHRTTVSAHIARTGKTRPRGRVAAETLDS